MASFTKADRNPIYSAAKVDSPVAPGLELATTEPEIPVSREAVTQNDCPLGKSTQQHQCQ